MHPLDLIALQHPGDPIGRLHAAMRWILAGALAELDYLDALLDLDSVQEDLHDYGDYPARLEEGCRRCGALPGGGWKECDQPPAPAGPIAASEVNSR